jgi:hypothetical protein
VDARLRRHHWSDWTLSKVKVPPDIGEIGGLPAGSEHPPDVVVHDITATKGQTFTGSQLLADLSDPDAGDTIVKVRFWDDHRALGTMDDNPANDSSGHFILNGQVLPEGRALEVNGADLDSLMFQSGSGTDLLWARAFDGMLWSDWQSFHVVAPDDTAPTVSGGASRVGVNQSVQAATLFAAADSDGDAIAKYEFWDSTPGAGSGHFEVNGVAQPARTSIDVLAADLDQASFVGGASFGIDHLWVRVSDGVLWSDWHPFDAVTHA